MSQVSLSNINSSALLSANNAAQFAPNAGRKESKNATIARLEESMRMQSQMQLANNQGMMAFVGQMMSMVTNLVNSMMSMMAGLFGGQGNAQMPGLGGGCCQTGATNQPGLMYAMGQPGLLAEQSGLQQAPKEEKPSFFSSLLDKGINFVTSRISDGRALLGDLLPKVTGFFGF